MLDHSPALSGLALNPAVTSSCFWGGRQPYFHNKSKWLGKTVYGYLEGCSHGQMASLHIKSMNLCSEA